MKEMITTQKHNRAQSGTFVGSGRDMPNTEKIRKKLLI